MWSWCAILDKINPIKGPALAAFTGAEKENELIDQKPNAIKDK